MVLGVTGTELEILHIPVIAKVDMLIKQNEPGKMRMDQKNVKMKLRPVISVS